MRGALIRKWYEAYTPDGALWCSSSDPDEVYRNSKRVDGIRYRVIATYEDLQIEDWDPTRQPRRHSSLG